MAFNTKFLPDLRTIGLALLIASPFQAATASAADRHQTDFAVKFGALTVGQVTFGVDVDGDNYTFTGGGRTQGLAEWFSPGNARIKSTGKLADSQVIASDHFLSVTENKKKAVLNIGFDAGNVTEVSLTPDKRKKRRNPRKYAVLTDEHLKGVIDPASALVIPVPIDNANDPKAVCNHTLRVYDGETRFDMVLSYKTNKPVKTKGYDGYAYVCKLKYVPVAGHELKEKNVKEMAANEDMEIWLAPIHSESSVQGIFTPIRILIPTWVGTFAAEPAYFGPARK